MSTPNATSARPSGPVRLVAAGLAHAQDWGAVWFGLVFWGSVLFATAQRVWPDAPSAPLLIGACGIGLVAGLGARRRGYWL